MSAENIKSISVDLKKLTVSMNSCASNVSPQEYFLNIKTFQDLTTLKSYIEMIVESYVGGSTYFLGSCKSPLFYYIQQAEFLQNQKHQHRLHDLDWIEDKAEIKERTQQLAEAVWEALISHEPIKREKIYVYYMENGNRWYVSRLSSVWRSYHTAETLTPYTTSMLHYFILMNRLAKKDCYQMSYEI